MAALLLPSRLTLVEILRHRRDDLNRGAAVLPVVYIEEQPVPVHQLQPAHGVHDAHAADFTAAQPSFRL